MLVRLKLLKGLMRDDGSIWISIDDREVHYLKVAADSVFGRENFVTTFIWQQRTTRENRKVFSNNHEYLLVYARDMLAFRRARSKLPPSDAVAARYKNPDNDPRGPWQSVSANLQAGHATPSQFYASLDAWLGAHGSAVAAGVRAASSVNLITGPSRAGDIEMTITVGVHGPREVLVVIVT